MHYLPLVIIGVIIAFVVFFIERRLGTNKRLKPTALLKNWGMQVLTEPAAKQWLAEQAAILQTAVRHRPALNHALKTALQAQEKAKPSLPNLQTTPMPQSDAMPMSA